MNTIEKFLADLLTSQELTKEQEEALQAHKKEVTDFLRSEFGSDPVIKYAGSREKGTMIKDNHDLDIVCYFPSSDDRSLKEIRDDVAVHLEGKYILQSKASAERILSLKENASPAGYHIDVVPGRFIENTKDVFLHVAEGEKERMQTNLKTHIDYIANSGCVPVIRLAKIWSKRNNINVKTFILELFIVETLKGSRNKDNLKESFLKVLNGLKDKFEKIQLIDPANTNNIVSRLISDSDKKSVAQAAKTLLSEINESDDLDKWKSAFKEKNVGANSSSGGKTTPSHNSPSVGFTPKSPWAN